MKDNCVLVFLESPTPKKIEKIYHYTFGSEKACKVYLESAKQVFINASYLSNAQVIFVYQPTPEHPDLRWVDNEDPGFLIPKGRTLTEQILNSIKWCFDAGAKKIVVLSAQAPNVSPKTLETAFEELNGKHFVLGPTKEGYSYLFGTRGFYPEIFASLPWDKNTFCIDAPNLAKKNRFTIHVLAESYIINNETNFGKWNSSQQDVEEEEPSLLNFADK
jgi:uncharacterized protein